MAHSNVLELETCLDECLAYCATHPKHEFVAFYHPRLQQAKERWVETVEVSDYHYLAWQKEFREDRVAWRKLSTELKKTQDALRRVNAVGYDESTVRHWDEELLTDAVNELLEYLRSRVDVLDIAQERIEALERLLGAAKSEVSDADTALSAFKRHVMFRADAMGAMIATIGDFRVAMRRELGKKSDEYRSIRWPMSVAPDEPVL